MRPRAGAVLLVLGLVASAAGAIQPFLGEREVNVVGDTTTTMLWVEGHKGLDFAPELLLAGSVLALAGGALRLRRNSGETP
jgi:hypothetical protein